jgi:hypothetical protein
VTWTSTMSSFRKRTAAEATRCCESLLGSVLQYVHVKKSSSPGRSQTTTCIHLPVQRRRRGTFHFGLAYEMRNVSDPRKAASWHSIRHCGMDIDGMRNSYHASERHRRGCSTRRWKPWPEPMSARCSIVGIRVSLNPGEALCYVAHGIQGKLRRCAWWLRSCAVCRAAMVGVK